MRPLLQNLAICLATGALAVSSFGAESLHWESDLQAAFQQAKVLNRPVLLHFATTDCVPCRRLEQTVFTQPRVTAAMQDFFVPVKIDANQHPDLAAQYGIKSVPHDVIVTPDGRELHRMTSPPQAEQYLAQLSAVAFRAGATQSVSSVAQQETPPALGRSDMDRHLAQAGRDPGDPDGRFSPNSTEIQGGSGPTTRSMLASTGNDSRPTRVDPYAISQDEEPEASPREVINRFARRGSDERNGVGAGPAPGPSGEAARREEVPPRGARWESWPRPDADRSPNEARPESQPQVNNIANRYPVEASERPAGPSPTGAPRQPPSANAGPFTATSPAQEAPPLGMDGFCPVSLVRDERWTKGDPRFGVIHRGRTYLFAGPDEKELFYADPDEYSPVLAGIDPVELTTSGATILGQRAHGVVYRKRVYLFSSEGNLQQFWEEPERYASPIRQAMETGDIGRLFR
jgi:YHS domain-containing protein/thiol-disulfide isomerase/thioredoxin